MPDFNLDPLRFEAGVSSGADPALSPQSLRLLH